MKRVLVIAVVAVLLLGACGDDDDGGALDGGGGGGGDLSAEEQAAVDKVAQSITDDPDGPQATEEEAQCVGTAMVEILGADTVNSIDFSAEEDPVLDEEQATAAADAFVDCIDVKAFFAKSFTEGAEISQESAECLTDSFTEDDVRDLLITGFQDPEAEPPTDFIQKITSAMGDCLTEEEFAEVTGG